jgi:uncharacterized damage-inducible protein DinB
MDLTVEFLQHNTMMNGRLLDACRQLTPDQLDATATGTYGTIGATLVHMANSQIGYGARFLDRQRERPERLEETPFPGFDAVSERFDLGNAWLEEASGRAGEEHDVQVTGDDPPGTWTMNAALLLLQAVNHGTEHRSQVATVLTTLGIEPPSMDGWTFFFEGDLMTPVD